MRLARLTRTPEHTVRGKIELGAPLGSCSNLYRARHFKGDILVFPAPTCILSCPLSIINCPLSIVQLHDAQSMLHDSLFPGACVSGGCHLLSPAKADAHAHRHVHAHTHHPDTRTTVIVMERSHASAYPTLSFVNINNPDETKLRSKKRAVRSHVAYYQHHKDDDKGGSRTTGSRRRRGKRAAQVQQAQPEDQTVSRRREPGSAHASSSSPVSTVASRGSSVSIKSEPGALSAPASRRGSLQLDHISLGTRVDPFHMYPVPWKDEYNPIIDFCKSSAHPFKIIPTFLCLVLHNSLQSQGLGLTFNRSRVCV